MQILNRFDKTDTSLWQKVLDAITSIYKSEEEAQQAKKNQQKARIPRWSAYSMKQLQPTGNVKKKST